MRFVIEQCIVVELKSVQNLTPVFEAQLLNYMKLLSCPKGILINFNCSNIFREGQKHSLMNILMLYRSIKELCSYVVEKCCGPF
jgi:hypothetical protein